eukprot:14596423-Alexandrium_andersonii.AAC.1
MAGGLGTALRHSACDMRWQVGQVDLGLSKRPTHAEHLPKSARRAQPSGLGPGSASRAWASCQVHLRASESC